MKCARCGYRADRHGDLLHAACERYTTRNEKTMTRKDLVDHGKLSRDELLRRTGMPDSATDAELVNEAIRQIRRGK